MKRHLSWLVAWALVLTAAEARSIVFVNGAFSGSRQWKEIGQLLSQKGFDVHRAQLTGLGARSHLLSPEISLSTHITDVCHFIEEEDLTDVVLVGYSYGGAVAQGVALRLSDRIGRLVLLDAIFLNSGQSCNDLLRELGSNPDAQFGPVTEGIYRPAWIAQQPENRGFPQPVRTFTEPLVFDPVALSRIATVYVRFVPEAASEPTPKERERFMSLGIRFITFAGDHWVHKKRPNDVAQLLAQLASGK